MSASKQHGRRQRVETARVPRAALPVRALGAVRLAAGPIRLESAGGVQFPVPHHAQSVPRSPFQGGVGRFKSPVDVLVQRGRRALGLLLCRGLPASLGLLGPAAAQSPDPLDAGLVWTAAPPVALPAIPRAVVFAARESLALAAWTGANPRVRALSTAGANVTSTSFEDDAVAGALSVITVTAGEQPDALFELYQLPAPDATHRHAWLRRLPTVSGSPVVPLWTHDTLAITNGPARCAVDAAGARVACALWRSTNSDVQLDWIDGGTGALLARTFLGGAALNEVVVSADSTRVAIAAGLDLWIVDELGAVRHHETLTQATNALAIAGDGRALAVGGRTVLRILTESGGSYATTASFLAPAHELTSRCALARDASTLAIGWWNFQNGVDLRFEVWDVPSHARLLEHVQIGIAGGLQNLPEAVRVTPDGRRAALGCWGDGTTKPEVVVFDRVAGSIVLQADLPGSVQGLALDARGERVLASMKATHANQFASTGELRLYSTGERDLALLGAPRTGQTLTIAARDPGASTCIFLWGAESPTPLVFPGITGTLGLRRTGLSAARMPADSNGRAEHTLAIPNDPLLRGTYLHLQAAFRTPGTTSFGATRIHALVE